MKYLLLNIITFYQKYIRLYKKPSCVFYPSCSTYSKQAIEKYGAFKGSYLAIRRILRCYPWQKKHMDPLE